MMAPFHAELAFGDHLCIRPPLFDRLQPPGEIGIVAEGRFPYRRHETEAIQCIAGVEMHGGGIDHLFAASFHAKVLHRFDRADTHAAIEAALKSFAAGGEKIAGPAVEADTVDEIGWALRGLQIVLAARVIGVADTPVAIAVVDAVLAPDLSLTY